MFQKTKDELFRLMQEYFGMDDKAVRTKLKSCDAPMPFDAVHWDKYIQCLTGFSSCRYCGAPTKRISPAQDAQTWWLHIPERNVCVVSFAHFTTLKVENIMISQEMHWKGKTREEAQEYVTEKLHRVCEHGELWFWCFECMRGAIKKREPGSTTGADWVDTNELKKA